MIARNKAAMVSNHSYKDKRHLIHSQDSEDHEDNNGNGIISSRTNGTPDHAKNGNYGDSDSLTIAHSRSKSAPAINQAGIRLRQRKSEKGKNHEDDDEDDDDYDECDDSDAEECYKRITEGSQHAQPEEPHKIRPHFTKNANGDSKISPKERSKTPVHLYSVKDKNNHQYNLHRSVESVEDKDFKNGGQKVNHVYDVPEGEDYMAIYETIDRKRQEAREMKNKSHSMEALETPNASIKGDDDQSSAFDFNITENSKKEMHLQKQSDSSSSSRRRHRSKPHESNKSSVKNASNSFHQQDHKRWSIHERSISTSEASNSYQSQPSKKLSSTTNGQSISTNGTAQSNSHQIIRSNMPNPDISNDVTDGSMASFLKRALRMEGPQLCKRTVTIKKTVRESLGMRIGGGIGSNEGDTPIYIANIHPHGCIGKSKNLKVKI